MIFDLVPSVVRNLFWMHFLKLCVNVFPLYADCHRLHMKLKT